MSHLKNYHEALGLDWNILNSFRYKQLRKKARKHFTLSSIRNQDISITIEHLHKFIHSLSLENHDDLILGTIATSLFFGLGRISDLLFSPTWDWPMQKSSIIKQSNDYIFLIEHPKIYTTHSQYLSPVRAKGMLNPGLWISWLLQSQTIHAVFPWRLKNGTYLTAKSFKEHFSKVVEIPLIGESSFRAGGASFLVSKGTPLDIILILGRWKGDAFQRYLRDHPGLIQSYMKALSSKSQMQ
jgi:hypothetical protein